MHPNDHPERRHRPNHAPHEADHAPEPSSAESPAGGTGAVRRATGKEREEWFALLDDWGATERSSREITGWLTEEHGISGWWAQKLRVEYEQARGIREPGARAGGTYAATASRTVGVSADRAFETVVDPDQRERWLSDLRLQLRSSRPARSARFDCDDGSTLAVFDFQPKGPSSCVVSVEHQRLSSSADADRRKTYWRERLTALRDQLQGGSTA